MESWLCAIGEGFWVITKGNSWKSNLSVVLIHSHLRSELHPNIYIGKQKSMVMVTKLHLHANFPHNVRRPDAALGYLKSALSEEKVDITNIYWYLLPRRILDSLLSMLGSFQGRYIEKSYRTPFLAAYLSRFFYKNECDKNSTVIESILRSGGPLERVENTARMLKNFIDYTIEKDGMADVDMAGFTVKLYQWVLSRYIWSKLKKENPNITIVVGGLDTKEEARVFMETFQDVDYAVWGEGESPLRELIRNVHENLEEVPRLVFRDGEDICTTDSSRTVPRSFYADHTDYFEQLKKYELRISPQIPIIGTRSCKWNRCKFCSLNKTAAYTERPVEDIVGEIEYQSKKYDVSEFLFVDSDIGRIHEKDFEELLTLLLESAARRKKPYEIWGEISPTRLTRQYVEMMNKIKIGVQIGFEALTDTLLKKMDKIHRFAENIQALKFGNDYTMDLPGLNILRNLPNVCEEDILESMKNLEFLRFFLHQYNLSPSELTLFKRSRYYDEIPQDEREHIWVVNFMYTEIERLNLIKEDVKWDFFGFRSRSLTYSQLWDIFIDLLEKLQSANIHYSWTEFPDGSSLVQEYNPVSGNREFLLDRVETHILKFCDSITSLQKLKKEFPHQDIEAVISELRKENLLYYEVERNRLISILSPKAITRM